MLEKAFWIWRSNTYGKDEYCEFCEKFNYRQGKLYLYIAADSNYCVWINGRQAAFGQYPGYPDYIVVDRHEVSRLCRKGENMLSVTVWYYGEDSKTYYKDEPGLIFELRSKDNIIAFSNENTLCRLSRTYCSHAGKLITRQLGFSFKYDSSKEDGWMTEQAPGFGKAVVNTVKLRCFFPRPVKKLKLKNRTAAKILLNEDNRHFIIDLKKERSGYLELEFYSDCRQEITVAFGEHIDDGKVRRIIGDRDFSAEYIAKPGANLYLNLFRRFGLRYLEVFCEQEIELKYIGLRPAYYPLNIVKFPFPAGLRKKIYDTCIYTLRLCMHEHYEDCPWREQALYTMDSRNQMLCGYYAFREYEFARANLVLISKGIRKDGLLSIAFPAGQDCPIPFFSLIYPIQVYEYIIHSGDMSVLDEVFPVIERIMDTFVSKIDYSGLIANFPYPYWNFYEWSENNHNYDENVVNVKDINLRNEKKVYDLALNAMLLIAFEYCKKLENCGAREIKSSGLNEKLKHAILKHFYNENEYIFSASTEKGREKVSQLSTSLAVLSGVLDKDSSKKVMEKLLDTDAVEITLSMKCFLYDAMLCADPGYCDYILNDIDKCYGYMLNKGATSFWETLKGADDFDGAGSLCHGWSAMPVYYYHKFLKV